MVLGRFHTKKKIPKHRGISIKSITQAHEHAQRRHARTMAKKKVKKAGKPGSSARKAHPAPRISAPKRKAAFAQKGRAGKQAKKIPYASKLLDSLKTVAEFRVGYLQILDQNGRIVNKRFEPKIPKETLIAMYKVMRRARAWDDKSLALQRSGRQGTFAPVMGQEGVQVGSIFALEKTDWAVPAFREAAIYLARGAMMASMFLYNMGSEDGSKGSPAMRTLPISVPVGSQATHAVGISLASKIKREDDITIVYFGDGATSEGECYEAINFAGVFQTPTIFLCQNNQWAISVPRERQSHAETLAQKGIAGGIPCIQVDGNDPLAVYAATKDAALRARTGGGPTFIEAITYRMRMHTTADDPKRYRTDEEVEAWKPRDPLIRFKKYLESKKMWSKKDEDALQKEIDSEVAKAVGEAERHQAQPEDMFTSVYAEPTAPLREQMQMLKARLEHRRQAQ